MAALLAVPAQAQQVTIFPPNVQPLGFGMNTIGFIPSNSSAFTFFNFSLPYDSSTVEFIFVGNANLQLGFEYYSNNFNLNANVNDGPVTCSLNGISQFSAGLKSGQPIILGPTLTDTVTSVRCGLPVTSIGTIGVQPLSVGTGVSIYAFVTNVFTAGLSVNAQNVEGIVPTGNIGTSVFPVIGGGLGPATNQFLNLSGIDVFSSTFTSVPGGTTGTATLGSPPTPTSTGETAFVFYGPITAAGSAAIVSPWSCVGGGGCGVNQLNVGQLNNYNSTQALQESFANGGGGTTVMIFVAYVKQPGSVGQSQRSANNATLTVAVGDSLLVGYNCSGTGVLSCGTNVQASDNCGNAWKLIAGGASVTGFNSSSLRNIPTYAFAALSTCAGSLTVTVNNAGGPGGDQIAFLDLTGETAAPLTAPSEPFQISGNRSTPNEDDQGGLFIENGGFDVTNTAILTASNNFQLWQQPQHGIFESCTVSIRVTAVSGTLPTLDTYFQDSGDNQAFNDRMHFPQAVAVGIWLGAVTSGAGGITPVATTDGAMAVSTKLDGPLSAFGRLKFVITGTTPSFTVVYNVACR